MVPPVQQPLIPSAGGSADPMESDEAEDVDMEDAPSSRDSTMLPPAPPQVQPAVPLWQMPQVQLPSLEMHPVQMPQEPVWQQAPVVPQIQSAVNWVPQPLPYPQEFGHLDRPAQVPLSHPTARPAESVGIERYAPVRTYSLRDRLLLQATLAAREQAEWERVERAHRELLRIWAPPVTVGTGGMGTMQREEGRRMERAPVRVWRERSDPQVTEAVPEPDSPNLLGLRKGWRSAAAVGLAVGLAVLACVHF
jgi:hypothetical protein